MWEFTSDVTSDLRELTVYKGRQITNKIDKNMIRVVKIRAMKKDKIRVGGKGAQRRGWPWPF